MLDTVNPERVKAYAKRHFSDIRDPDVRAYRNKAARKSYRKMQADPIRFMRVSIKCAVAPFISVRYAIYGDKIRAQNKARGQRYRATRRRRRSGLPG